MVRKWSSLSAEGLQQKKGTVHLISNRNSMVQSFFCVRSFSLCSNLSMWPGIQVVPDESRCYIPIFDGLVYEGPTNAVVFLSFVSLYLGPFQRSQRTSNATLFGT